jgi:phosphoglucomutase
MCPGASGFEQMKRIMDGLRVDPPRQIGDHTVSAVLDYKTLRRKDLQTGDETDIDCIPGNVLVFEFGDHRKRITVRPSGTEPNIKLYVQWFEEADNSQAIADQYDALGHHVNGLSKQFEGHLLEF